MTFGSLASDFFACVVPPPGSLDVAWQSTLETKIRPSLPSNFTPFGISLLITIFTPLSYRASVLKMPCTFRLSYHIIFRNYLAPVRKISTCETAGSKYRRPCRELWLPKYFPDRLLVLIVTCSYRNFKNSLLPKKLSLVSD